MSTAEGTDAASAVTVEFELTPEEWVEVALEHNNASPLMRKQLRDARGLMGTIVVLLAILTALNGDAFFAIMWLVMGGTALAMFPRLIRHSARKQYQRFAEAGIANGMFGAHRVKLLEQGMLDETDAYQWLTRWPAIDRVEDGEGSFMIYTGKNAFLPIPHTAFRDSAQLRAFADYFYKKLGAAEDEAGALPAGSAPPIPERGETL